MKIISAQNIIREMFAMNASLGIHMWISLELNAQTALNGFIFIFSALLLII